MFDGRHVNPVEVRIGHRDLKPFGRAAGERVWVARRKLEHGRCALLRGPAPASTPTLWSVPAAAGHVVPVRPAAILARAPAPRCAARATRTARAARAARAARTARTVLSLAATTPSAAP